MSVVDRFIKHLDGAKTIAISTHLHPDADGIGSEISLCMALKKKGLQAICVNEEELLDRYRYLDPERVVLGVDSFQKEVEWKDKIDLFVVVDTNGLHRVGKQASEIAKKAKKVVFVDHHPYLGKLEEHHCIDTNMAATGELVGMIIERLGLPFNMDLAQALYTSILIDTSSFRYPTVSANTHRLVAKLLDTGITPSVTYNKIYGTTKISHMKVLGEILSQASTNKDETIAWIMVPEKLLKKHHIDIEDTLSFINHLLILDHIKVACMFSEDSEKKQVKMSMRSSGDVDVGELARELGGGGHGHSAAAVFEGKMKDVVKKAIAGLEKLL